MEVLHRVVCDTTRHTGFAPTRPTLPQLRELPRDEGGDYGTVFATWQQFVAPAGSHSIFFSGHGRNTNLSSNPNVTRKCPPLCRFIVAIKGRKNKYGTSACASFPIYGRSHYTQSWLTKGQYKKGASKRGSGMMAITRESSKLI